MRSAGRKWTIDVGKHKIMTAEGQDDVWREPAINVQDHWAIDENDISYPKIPFPRFAPYL
jgi:hypothetical protein